MADSTFKLPPGATSVPSGGAKGKCHPLNEVPVKSGTPIPNFPR